MGMEKGTPTWTPNVYDGVTNVQNVGGMVGKIAEQVIREVTADDRLAIFDKKPITNGDTIEQVVIKLAEKRPYNHSGSNALTRVDPDMAVRYFKGWTRDMYKTSVDTSEIRLVLTGGKNISEISTKLVGELSEGATQDKYEYLKGLLKDSRQTADGGSTALGGTLKAFGTVAYSSGVQYKKILTELKNVVSKMTFVNADCNTASIKRKTNMEDIVILMPYYLKNEIDVNELSGVFNLDKAEVGKHIIEIDEPIASKNSYIYVVDKNAILQYTRLFEMDEQKNGDGHFWNYFLHVERLYAISPLFDCGYIKVGMEA